MNLPPGEMRREIDDAIGTSDAQVRTGQTLGERGWGEVVVENRTHSLAVNPRGTPQRG